MHLTFLKEMWKVQRFTLNSPVPVALQQMTVALYPKGLCINNMV